MFAPIAPPSPTQLFEESRELCDRTIRGFIKRHGGDYDDYASRSNDLFLDAYETYYVTDAANYVARRQLTTWDTWLRRWWWSGFADMVRSVARRKVRVTCCELNPNALTYTDEPEFELATFMGELSEDARAVVGLSLAPPPELASVAAGKGGSPRNFRSTLRQHLRAVGWAAERITETFDEIGTVLQS